jgi:subtilisin family serine protease
MRRVQFAERALQLIVGLMLAAPALVCEAGLVSRDLERFMSKRGSVADTRIIVRFADPLDQQPFAVTDRRARDNRLVVALKARAARNRAAVAPLLAAQGATRIKDLWIINGLAATVSAAAVSKLAADPAIARIDLDSFVQGGRSQRTPPSRSERRHGERAAAPPAALPPLPAEPEQGAVAPAKPEWNIAAVHAPDLWAQGHTGKGVVVAVMDTGVDLAHPALRRSWRGGANSWFDPHGEEATPYDALGHGTQAAGIIFGGAGVGVAPDARWIAVRLYDNAGHTSMSDIHRGFQWLMDPDGDPATVDAPDVVNASWALTGRVIGSCILEFAEDIGALRSAGIALVFAAGNDGPFPRSSNSPGNNPGALSVGAVNAKGVIARQTSRGPSSCDGAVFPRLLAPGVDVRTTDLSHGGTPSYRHASGSSLAAPHVAGVLALLAGAFPSASVAQLEAALLRGPGVAAGASAPQNSATRLADALSAFNALREPRSLLTNSAQWTEAPRQ